jgi:hypothetical protein
VTGSAEEQRQGNNSPELCAHTIVDCLCNRRIGKFEKTGLNHGVQPLANQRGHLAILCQTGGIVGAVTDQEKCGVIGVGHTDAFLC